MSDDHGLPGRSADELVRRIAVAVMLVIALLVASHAASARWPGTWIATAAGLVEWIVVITVLLPLLFGVLGPVIQLAHGSVLMVARALRFDTSEAGSAIRTHPTSTQRVRAALTDSFALRLTATGAVVLAVQAVVAAVR